MLYQMTPEEVARFMVFGGECNYLLHCAYSDDGTRVVLKPVAPEVRVWVGEGAAQGERCVGEGVAQGEVCGGVLRHWPDWTRGSPLTSRHPNPTYCGRSGTHLARLEMPPAPLHRLTSRHPNPIYCGRSGRRRTSRARNPPAGRPRRCALKSVPQSFYPAKFG